jgi:hypothetical protein
MDAIIIVTRKDIFIGEVMITGTTLIDLISGERITTGMSTTNGESTVIGTRDIVTNFF